MNQSEKIVQCAVVKVNELLFDAEALSAEWNTVILGADARLDSMGFVNFVTALEECLEAEAKVSMNIAEEINQAVDSGAPLNTLRQLADFLAKRLAAANP